MKILKEIILWKKNTDGSVTRYFCFQDLELDKYCVQNADFYHSPVNENDISQLDQQAIELILEESPEYRCDWFDSINEAVKAHDSEFE
ncbi:hypothetical protein [Marinibactrum halimedae]|uniref:Uncharacterized protein n=1 Tax=Marinibactrum halimedae TaxID=1444977 RepID=A0AA37TC58_9GAMM|nr:hypothetical protein [Marinibactrum halimedae]MCD9461302.1 hypothetical protein [Marinibactrum halimedae]GLS27581.1 hypothetical protein GCM10007877_33000 [Marinibactrum halimedae]